MYFVSMQQLLCRSVDPGLSEQPRPTDLKDIQKDSGIFGWKDIERNNFSGRIIWSSVLVRLRGRLPPYFVMLQRNSCAFGGCQVNFSEPRTQWKESRWQQF